MNEQIIRHGSNAVRIAPGEGGYEARLYRNGNNPTQERATLPTLDAAEAWAYRVLARQMVRGVQL